MGVFGKRVLLTADGDEISKGIAYHLAKAGCRLALVGDKNRLQSVAGELIGSLKEMIQIEVVGLNMEEENAATFDAAVDTAFKLLGGLDAFVNGYIHEGKNQDPLLITEDEYKKNLRVNMMAPWFLMQAVAKRMRDHKTGGAIVFLSSVVGAERSLYPEAAAFGTSMAGIQQLLIISKIAGMQIGKHNIRVNAVARGLHLDDEYPKAVGREKAIKGTSEAMPRGRWLDPKNDLASTVLCLVSDGARYMTGTTIFVDGAQPIVRPRMKFYIR